MVYLIYGLVVWPLAGVSYYLRRDAQLLLVFFAVLIYVLLIGFSYKSGSDWFNYFSDYQAGCVNPNFDVGFRAICSVFYWLDVDYWYFVAFVKCFYILVVGSLVLRVGVAPLAALVVYVVLSAVFLENLLRQQIAAALVIIAIFYLRNSFFWALMWLLGAAFFHVSALACVPLVLLYRYAWLRGFFFAAAIVFFFLQAFGIFAFVDVSRFLLESFSGHPFAARVAFYIGFDRYPVTLGHFLRLVLLIFYGVLFYKSRRAVVDQDRDYWVRVSYCAVLLMFFYEMVFYDFGVFWMRVREYFMVFLVLFPIVWVRQYCSSFWIPTFMVITAYAAFVFYGFYSLPVFEELYHGYANTVAQQFGGGAEFDRQRDFAAEEYWGNWQKGELR